MKLVKYIVLIGAVCAAFTVQPAKAVTFPSTLNVGNEAIDQFGSNFGTVDLVLDTSTTATVTFTSNISGDPAFLFGDGSTVAVNVNVTGTGFTITNITGSQVGTGFDAPLFSVANPPGTSNVDGLGLFNGVIDTHDGFKEATHIVSFTLTNVGGTWASAGDVLVANSHGFDAAAHIFVTSNGAGGINQKNGAIATGFAGEAEGPSFVPDGGATAMLLGLGLSGLGFVRRFVKR
jgi:protein with PEP-CTERM/exosortase system signal